MLNEKLKIFSFKNHWKTINKNDRKVGRRGRKMF